MKKNESRVSWIVEANVDSRSRLTLPMVVRRHLGLSSGCRLTFTVQSGGSVILSSLASEEFIPHQANIAAAERAGTSALRIDTTEMLVREGHLVTAEVFQKMMGWSTRRAVWKALAARRVFAMPLGTERYFPAFYADLCYQQKQLEAVTKKLGDLRGGAKLQFFVSRRGALNGKTVLEALAAGQFEKVMRMAETYAET